MQGHLWGLISAFATLGLDGIVIRELIKDESKRDTFLGTAFWLKIMAAFVMIIMIAIAAQFTSNDHYTNILVFIIAGSTIFQAFNVIDFYFQAKVFGQFIAMANSITVLLSSIVKIALIIYKAPLIAFVWAVAFDNLILALGYIYFYRKVSRHHDQPSILTPHLSHFTSHIFCLTFNMKIFKKEIDLHPYLKEGQTVRIKSGAFQGVTGILKKKEKTHYLIVSIDILKRSVCIKIDTSLVELV